MDSVTRSNPYPYGDPALGKSVLEEANDLISKDRLAEYGSFSDNAKIWSKIGAGLTGLDLEPEHLPLLMVALKLSRLIDNPSGYHRDSVVDAAGYIGLIDVMHTEGLFQ